MGARPPIKPDGKPMWYGRRRTHKLRPARERLVEQLLPKLRIMTSQAGPQIDLHDAFGGTSDALHLEIGFGAHLSAEALAHPNVNFIGCEPFINGVARLLADIAEHQISNIRLFDDDARILLDRMPEASVDRIYLLYPDPWPKARHNRRRFVNSETLDQLAFIAKDGAEFIFASDHMGYVGWTLAEIYRHSKWSWLAQTPSDWRDPPANWSPTRYETKAKKKGIKPAYLTSRRNPRV